ncbi:Zinc ion binding, putative isoform 1 [Hibiscus syriacus]|uniref:Zinc ion binding, putative isoform 1 n=1 Tax=Hibiscus syriacus TaxID=106335 RepID=A0A6A2XXQ5_HIBSY|nr:formin-like protein 5 [Hibiscus syriacus]KAE8667076.1 Zinc ion binding, putative isoform 1 [Hibiscus syriacus]
MEVNGDPPPLWPQLPTSASRRRPPSPIFSLPVLIILLPILALLLLFMVVPPFLSVTAQILRPLGIRKSWDSLNVFLVLFAIICGVLARRNDEEESNNGNGIRNYSISDNSKESGRHVYVSQQWFEHSERKTYDGGAPINMRPSPASDVRRLKRSSSSYPDLRQDSLWENNEDRSWRSGFEESEAKVIPVDTFVLRSSLSSPPSKSPPPPPPPPPPASHHKPKRSYQAVGQNNHKVMNQNDRVDFSEIKSPSVTPPPPPPPPPRRPPSPLVQVGNRSEQKYGKLERRRSTATKEIKMVFASLRKRKRKHKSQDHDHQQDCPLHSPTEPQPYYSTSIQPTSLAPPPPPPPPPPPTFLQKYNLFRKASKSKKIHSIPTPPPPPPTAAFSFSKRSSKQNIQIPQAPPPAPPSPTFYTNRLSKQNSQIPPPEPSRKRTTANNGKPPLPTKANNISYYDENVNSGGQSPLIPTPPPPPPFKMPNFKLVIRGDFVKIRSSPSSRCSSPDLEEISKDETETASMTEGDDGVGVAGVPVCCPSPDVNAKAETFIARLRDGWKLEKINSIKEKQRM